MTEWFPGDTLRLQRPGRMISMMSPMTPDLTDLVMGCVNSLNAIGCVVFTCLGFEEQPAGGRLNRMTETCEGPGNGRPGHLFGHPRGDS